MRYAEIPAREWRIWLNADAKRHGGTARQALRLGIGYTSLRYLCSHSGEISAGMRLRLSLARERVESQAGAP